MTEGPCDGGLTGGWGLGWRSRGYRSMFWSMIQAFSSFCLSSSFKSWTLGSAGAVRYVRAFGSSVNSARCGRKVLGGKCAQGPGRARSPSELSCTEASMGGAQKIAREKKTRAKHPKSPGKLPGQRLKDRQVSRSHPVIHDSTPGKKLRKRIPGSAHKGVPGHCGGSEPRSLCA